MDSLKSVLQETDKRLSMSEEEKRAELSEEKLTTTDGK